MDKRDLKICSNVFYNNEICKIENIVYDHACLVTNDGKICIPISDIQPIPITEEIIAKLGFIEHTNKYMKWKEYRLETNKGYITIAEVSNSIDKNWSIHIDNLDYDSCANVDIKYLHDIQNIVWTCLNIELEIK